MKEGLPASPWLLVCVRAVLQHHCRGKMCMAVAHWGPALGTAIEEVTFSLGSLHWKERSIFLSALHFTGHVLFPSELLGDPGFPP